jgi:hypothetical protein
MHMEGKSSEQRPKNFVSSRSRFESMSWLYRDGLTYQGALKKVKDSTLRQRAKNETEKTTLQTDSPVKANQKGKGDRFASMSWLYRDNLPGVEREISIKPVTEQPTAPSKSESQVPTKVVVKPVTKTQPKTTDSKDKYAAMRWLYDDDESYNQAVEALKAEEATRQAKKQQAKEARANRIRGVQTLLTNGFTRVAQLIRSQPKKAAIAGGVVLLLTVVGGVVVIGGGKESGAPPRVAGDTTNKVEKMPEFDTVLPANDTEQISSAIAYDELRKTASYTDMLDSNQITVTQQQLPNRFKVNQQAELEEFAKEINCNQLIQAGDTRAYAGVSVRGPQTVILIKNELLIFMTTDSEMPTGAWVAYIESLQ